MRCALRLAALGWFVFPLRRGDKKPLPNFTRWEQRATIDEQRIYSWWRDGAYNIGIATGRSDLIIVDCDTARGATPPAAWAGARDGLEVLRQLAKREGAEVPKTFTVQTPSGGVHLYFTAPPTTTFGNTAGKLGWRIDTRARGGYVVAPGSLIAGTYYRAVQDIPPAPLPAWITEALTPKTPIALTAPRTRYSSRSVPAIMSAQLARVAEAQPGSRNSTLNVAAFVLGRLVGGHEITEHEAWTMLLDVAGSHVGVAGFTAAEMERTIRSGLTAGMRRP
jgi:hypothetical protein